MKPFVALLNQDTLCSKCRHLDMRLFHESHEKRGLNIALSCNAGPLGGVGVLGRATECSGYVEERRFYRELAWR